MNRRPAQLLHRTPPVRPRWCDDRGSAIFLLLILAVVMASIMAGIYSYISSSANLEKRSDVRLESTYAAEYAFEQAYQQLNTLVGQDTQNLPDIAHTTAVTNLAMAPTSVFGSADGYTWKTYLTVPVEGGVPVASHSNFNPTQGVYKFMTIVEFDRQVPPMVTPVHMQFQREWDYSLTPLFQYAIFYNGDMELFPGAAFLVSGRVHSNGKIYTGTTASITFADRVTDVNGVVNQHMASDPRGPATLNGSLTYDKGPPSTTSTENPPGASTANLTDTNPNNDGPHELIDVPDVHSPDPNASDRMYDKAGLKILVNSTNSTVTAASGVSIPPQSSVLMTTDGTVIPSTDPLAQYLSSVTSSGSFHDYREGSTFTTTTVDVSKLDAAYNSGALPQTIPNSSNWPNNGTVPSALKNQPIPSALQGKSFWNGILYVTDVTNSTSHRTGVELINGQSLPDGSNSSSPSTGLTVATDNAAFIVGDYNTGGTPPVDTGSATANNYAGSYTVEPAAVIADAVTVVSSNWTSSNYNNQSSLSRRKAANTTINTALVSGIVPTSSNGYSGGVENYIRLLEDWGGKRLTYFGSMINVYNSEQSTAPWKDTGNYYQAPARNWHFDTQYLNPNRLPPGTPIVRSLMRGQWVQVE